MNPLRRAARKARYLFETRVEARLFAERVAPAVAPRLFRPRRGPVPDPADVRSVLVWNVDSLGDFLWTTPTLRALRTGYPAAAITLVCNRACLLLAETNPHVDRIVPVDPAPFYAGRGLFRTVPELRGKRFDVMLVLEMGSRPADAGRVIGRRLGVGYLVSSDLGLLKRLPDHTLPPNRDRYWPAYFLQAAEHLGVPGGSPELEVYPTAADEVAAAEMMPASLGVVDVGFHPNVAPYAGLTKKWPDDSFVELARLLAGRRPTRFVLTGSPDEAAACDRLADRIRAVSGAEVVTTAGRLPLRAVAALYRRLAVLIVGDTAALHLAAAADTPTVALFGATDPRLIAPASRRCVVLTRDLPCRPCFEYRDRRPEWPRCIFARPKCLEEITPAEAAAAVDRVAGGSRTRDRQTADEMVR